MKKKLLIITGLLLLLVAGVIFSTPLLIENQKIQKQLLARMASSYGIDASVQDLTFTWFPLPRLQVGHIEVLHQNFSATSPQATLYPSWKILFGVSSLGRLNITDPVLRLHKITSAGEGEGATAISLPGMKLHIENGRLHLPALHGDMFASRQVSLHDIAATLTIRANRGQFSWASGASFAKKITLVGDFSKKTGVTVSGEVKKLHGQKIATANDQTFLMPLADHSNFSFSLTRKAADLNIALRGDIPDFSLSRLDTREDFKLGHGDLALYLGPRGSFSLLIKDLLVHEPQLQIKGEIGRYFPGDRELAHIKIDLQAEEIDLSALRHKVLGLLGDNPVAQIVCDIVQGGKAHSASYFFDAPARSFEDVTSMTIEVDIADSDIHLAAIPLDLSNARGPILIKDGDLTGRDIITWVGDAKGTNGVFLVGLANDKHGLEVDVDIDANLEELPAVLRTLIADGDVVHELGMVQASGRANGHLHIGDDLRDFHVVVDVDRYDDAELRYDRLSWPLRPESGNLQVTDTSISWLNIKAKMGAHSILESSGQAAWDDPDIPLAIHSLQGLFDSYTLLGELRKYPVLDEAFSGVIDSAQGQLEISGALKGPFFKPQEYTYSFDAKLADVTFKTPALPEGVLIERGQGTIGHRGIQILASSGSLLAQKINLRGELFHDQWQSWSGNLQVDGILGSNHLSWLTSKEAFPRLLMPRPTYHVANMDIRWDDQLFSLLGKLYSADETTSLDLDIQERDTAFSASFRIKGPRDAASFALQWQDNNETFSSSFAGNISGQSLHALLDDSNFSLGTISGDFTVHKRHDRKLNKAVLDFEGDLVGQDIHWKWGKEHRLFTIPTVDLVGEDSRLRIRELKADFNNESLTATGIFSSKPGAGHFEVDLVSPPSLTSTNIKKIQADLDHFLHTTLAIKKEPAGLSTYEISGLLNFHIDRLILPFGRQGTDSGRQYPYKLPFAPLKGTYEFDQAASTMNLLHSDVCGVGVNGQLIWDGSQKTSKKFSLLTPADDPLEFKEFLSCFDFGGIIEGPLTISGRIHSDINLNRQGGLLLFSDKGTIKKFVPLAKILSLVNITGLSGAIWKEGFYYNALEVSGNVYGNIFTIDKAFIDGDGVDVVATGEINLTTMEYDLTIFVVPFSTITGLVTKVPLVGRVLGGQEGRIVSVPVKVTGPLDDPVITVLSPSAIGEATRKWILDTITLPFGWMLPPPPDTVEK